MSLKNERMTTTKNKTSDYLTTDEILFASGFFMSMFLIEYCNWSKKRVDYLFDNLSKFNK